MIEHSQPAAGGSATPIEELRALAEELVRRNAEFSSALAACSTVPGATARTDLPT